jgi:hypothetical protein
MWAPKGRRLVGKLPRGALENSTFSRHAPTATKSRACLTVNFNEVCAPVEYVSRPP